MTADKLKKRKEIESFQKVQKIQYRSVIWVVVIYFAILITLIQLTMRLGLPITVNNLSAPRFSPWFWILIFTYYGLPVVIALLAGYAFRPFWRVARDVFWAIILIHGVYSFLAFVFLADYYDEYSYNMRESYSGDLKIEKFKQEKIDKHQDGIIEKIRFKTMFDVSDFAGGQYLISLYLTQFNKKLPGNLGVYKFIVTDHGEEFLNIDFSFNPQRYNQYFVRGPLDVNIELKKIISVDDEGQHIASICRWAAFYRPVSWAGEDTRIQDNIIALQQ